MSCILHFVTSVLFLFYSEEDKATVLGEAEIKLSEIRHNFWYYVALELRGEDPYKFLRAFTGGE